MNLGKITNIPTINGYSSIIDPSTQTLAVRSLSSWLPQTIVSSSNYDVKWIKEFTLFLLCGDDIETSYDGKTWIVRSSTPAKSVAIDDGKKVSVIVGGSVYQITNDGITWTNGTIENNAECSSLCFSNELGIFCAISNNKSYISTDGINWTSSSTGIVTQSIQSTVCWSPKLGKFVCIDSTNYKCYSSTNGNTWTTSYYGRPFSTSIIWIPDLATFVSSGMITDYNDDSVAISSDGITWNGVTSITNTSWYSRACWSPELHLYLTGGNMTGSIVYSYNLINYYTSTFPSGTMLQAFTWSNELGVFCATEPLMEHIVQI